MALSDNNPAGDGFEQLLRHFSQAELTAVGVEYCGLDPDPYFHGRSQFLSAFGNIQNFERSDDTASAYTFTETLRTAWNSNPSDFLDAAGITGLRKQNLQGNAVLHTPRTGDLSQNRILCWQGLRTVWLIPTVVAGGATYTINLQNLPSGSGTVNYVAGAGETVTQVVNGIVSAWNTSLDETVSTITAEAVSGKIVLTFDAAQDDDTFFSHSTLTTSVNNGATLVRKYPDGFHVMPILFWGGSGATASVRIGMSWQNNTSSPATFADWVVSGAPNTPEKGRVVIRLFEWPYYVITQLPEGEYIGAKCDHQLDGGWPFITRDETIHDLARTLFNNFVDAVYDRWEATLGPGHGWNIDIVILDTEFTEERFSLGQSSRYNWYTANNNYNPNTTWHADFIDRITNDHPELIEDLFLTNIAGINSWPATSGEDTYRYNEGVRNLQTDYIKYAIVDVIKGYNPQAIVSDYEWTLKSTNCGAGGQPGGRWGSPIGSGDTADNTWSRNLYRSNGATQGVSFNAWFGGVGSVTVNNWSDWVGTVHDAISFQGGINAASPNTIFMPWVACGSAYNWNNTLNSYSFYLWLAICSDYLLFWNSSPADTARDEAIMLQAVNDAYGYTEGKQTVPIGMPFRLTWSNATNRNADISQDVLLHDGERILNINLVREDDDNYSSEVTFRENFFLLEESSDTPAPTINVRSIGMSVRGAGKRNLIIPPVESSSYDALEWSPAELGAHLIALWDSADLVSSNPGLPGNLTAWNSNALAFLDRDLSTAENTPLCVVNGSNGRLVGSFARASSQSVRRTATSFSNAPVGFVWIICKWSGSAANTETLFSLGSSSSINSYISFRMTPSGGFAYPGYVVNGGSGNTFASRASTANVVSGSRIGWLLSLNSTNQQTKQFISINGGGCYEFALLNTYAGTGTNGKFFDYPATALDRIGIGCDMFNNDTNDTNYATMEMLQIGMANVGMGINEDRIRLYVQELCRSMT